MAEFFYTQALDEQQLVRSNLQSMFTNLSAKVTANFDLEQFKRNAVRYKHLRVPFRIYLEDEAIGAALHGGLTKDGTTWNWTNARVKHQQSVANAPNVAEAGHPVVCVHGSLISHEWQIGSYEIGLGYSTNGGSSFTYWPNSNAFLGETRAHEYPLWTGVGTTHYHTGAGGYFPGSMFAKREAHTLIGAMTFGAIDITAITDWALGIRVNYVTGATGAADDLHALDRGRIRLIARDIA